MIETMDRLAITEGQKVDETKGRLSNLESD